MFVKYISYSQHKTLKNVKNIFYYMLNCIYFTCQADLSTSDIMMNTL